jgi:hypothetical protein
MGGYYGDTPTCRVYGKPYYEDCDTKNVICRECPLLSLADHDAGKDAEIEKLKSEILCLTVCPDFDKVDLDLAKEAADEQKRRAEIDAENAKQ